MAEQKKGFTKQTMISAGLVLVIIVAAVSYGMLTNTVSRNKEDIKTIMEKTDCTEEQAKQALEKTGDLAEAILKLSD